VTLQVGEPVGSLTFVGPDGSALPLAAFADRPPLLVFLRHPA
jgi:hypothetical protein